MADVLELTSPTFNHTRPRCPALLTGWLQLYFLNRLLAADQPEKLRADRGSR